MQFFGHTTTNELEQVLLGNMAKLPGDVVDDEGTALFRCVIVLDLLDGVVWWRRETSENWHEISVSKQGNTSATSEPSR